MGPVARTVASNEGTTRASAVGEQRLRQASLISTRSEEFSEVKVEDVIAGPARPAPILFRPEAPKVTNGNGDLEELVSESIASAQQALQRLAERARWAARCQVEDSEALREGFARPRCHVRPDSRDARADSHARPDSREAWTEPCRAGARGTLPQQLEVEDSDGEDPPCSQSPPRGTFTYLDTPSFSATSPSKVVMARSNAASRVDGSVKRRQTQDIRTLLAESTQTAKEVFGRRQSSRLAVFPNADDMKAKVRTYVLSQEYNVSNFYKKHGLAQLVARSNAFEYITLTVIGMNALWISVDVDENTSTDPTKAPVSFQIMDNIFCGYFFIEWLVRFAAFELKKNCLRDRWFVFDSFLVGLTVVDTWLMALVFLYFPVSSGPGDRINVLRLFRLLRLTRMARMVRLLRAAPELMILVRGMAAASRSVALTLVLLTGVIYIYAIVFRQITDGTIIGEQYFESIPASMSSLLLRATLPDMGDILEDTGNSHILLGVLMFTFILIATLTVLNMLVGVLVEVVSVVATVEREELTMASVKSNMERLFEMAGLDVDSTNCVSRSEFQNLLEIPEAVKMIHEVGVDVVGLIDYADMIFEGYQKELSFAEFFDVLLSLRGNNSATVKDIVDLRKFVYSTMSGQYQQAQQSGVFDRAASERAEHLEARRSLDCPSSPAETGKLTATMRTVSQESV